MYIVIVHVQILFYTDCLNIFKYPLSRGTTKSSLYKSFDQDKGKIPRIVCFNTHNSVVQQYWLTIR